MTFKANGALFKQGPAELQKRMGDRYDASKNYPEYDGVLSIAADQVELLVHYLMNAVPSGDRQEVPIRISGWRSTAMTSGVQYLSLQFQPDLKVLRQIQDASVPTQQAAQSLAQATGGVVVSGDLF